MKHEILQPVKHFNMHDDPLTKMETLHLVLWREGLSIAGYDQSGAVLTTKVYTIEQAESNTFESIFINEPLVAGPQPVTHIWIAEERNMLIPQHLFEEHAAAEWLRQFHFIEAGEQICTGKMAKPWNMHIVYPIQEKLHNLLHKYFGENKIRSLSEALLCQPIPSEVENVDITVLNNTILLSVHQYGKLLTHQVFPYTTTTDLVYKIASICQDYALRQDKMKVALSGVSIPDEMPEELKAFFPRITIPGSEQFLSFTLLSKLISCAS